MKKNIFKILFLSSVLVVTFQNSGLAMGTSPNPYATSSNWIADSASSLWNRIKGAYGFITTTSADKILGFATTNIHSLTAEPTIPQLVPSVLSENAINELNSIGKNKRLAETLASKTKSPATKQCLSTYKHNLEKIENLIDKHSEIKPIIVTATKTYDFDIPTEPTPEELSVLKKQVIAQKNTIEDLSAKQYPVKCRVDQVTKTTIFNTKDSEDCKASWMPWGKPECTKTTTVLDTIKNTKYDAQPVQIDNLDTQIFAKNSAENIQETHTLKVKCTGIPQVQNTTTYPLHSNSTTPSTEQFEYAQQLIEQQDQARQGLTDCLDTIDPTTAQKILTTNTCSIDKQGQRFCTTLKDEIALQTANSATAQETLTPKPKGFFPSFWENLPESVKTSAKWIGIGTVVIGGTTLVGYLIANDYHNIKNYWSQTSIEKGKRKILTNIMNNLQSISIKIGEISAPKYGAKPLNNLATIQIPKLLTTLINNRNIETDNCLLDENAFLTNIENNIIANLTQDMRTLNQHLTQAVNDAQPVQYQLPPQQQQGNNQFSFAVNVGVNTSNIEELTGKKNLVQNHIEQIQTEIQHFRDLQNIETEAPRKQLGLITTIIWVPIKRTEKTIKWISIDLPVHLFNTTIHTANGTVKAIKWIATKPIWRSIKGVDNGISQCWNSFKALHGRAKAAILIIAPILIVGTTVAANVYLNSQSPQEL